jgi:hypothetical protein
MDNAMRGRRIERFGRLREGIKPLKGEAQGRYRCETKPGRLREEEGVKRLRKSEGAAQPGEVSPVWVASRCFKRRRAMKLQEGRRTATVDRGSYSGAEPKPMRGRSYVFHVRAQGGREDLRGQSER